MLRGKAASQDPHRAVVRRADRADACRNAPLFRWSSVVRRVGDETSDDALAFCEQQLQRCIAACRHEEASSAAFGFANAPDAEKPEAWTRTVTEAIHACGLPGELVDVDCDAYPCVAELELEAASESADDLRERLGRAWNRCPVLLENMGWTPDDPHRSVAAAVEVFTFPDCPDTKVAVLLAVAPDGPVARADRGDILHDDAAAAEWMALQGRMYERIGRVIKKWRCDE